MRDPQFEGERLGTGRNSQRSAGAPRQLRNRLLKRTERVRLIAYQREAGGIDEDRVISLCRKNEGCRIPEQRYDGRSVERFALRSGRRRQDWARIGLVSGIATHLKNQVNWRGGGIITCLSRWARSAFHFRHRGSNDNRTDCIGAVMNGLVSAEGCRIAQNYILLNGQSRIG